jgi:hypothetical protein
MVEQAFLDYEADRAIDALAAQYHLPDTARALPDMKWALVVIGGLVVGAALGLVLLKAVIQRCGAVSRE